MPKKLTSSSFPAAKCYLYKNLCISVKTWKKAADDLGTRVSDFTSFAVDATHVRDHVWVAIRTSWASCRDFSRPTWPSIWPQGSRTGMVQLTKEGISAAFTILGETNQRKKTGRGSKVDSKRHKKHTRKKSATHLKPTEKKTTHVNKKPKKKLQLPIFVA